MGEGGDRELYCRLDVTVLFFVPGTLSCVGWVGGGASGRVGVERGDQRLSSWMGRPVVKHPASTRAVASTYVRLASGSSIVLQTPLRRTTTTTPRPWLSLCLAPLQQPYLAVCRVPSVPIGTWVKLGSRRLCSRYFFSANRTFWSRWKRKENNKKNNRGSFSPLPTSS